jgi:hypothetical protein
MFSEGAVIVSAQWQNRWLESPYVYSMSVCVITVRYPTPEPFPSKPAPEIFGGGQSIC